VKYKTNETVCSKHVKVKTKLFLCLIKYHVMKTIVFNYMLRYEDVWGSRITASRVLKHGARCKFMVSFMSRPFYSWGNIPIRSVHIHEMSVLRHRIHLFYCAFTSIPSSLLAHDRTYVFPYFIYVFAQNIKSISTEQKLMCSVNSSLSWFSWFLLMLYSKAKMKNTGGKASPYLMKWIKHDFTNADFTIGFV
jgi:hypothetical protein